MAINFNGVRIISSTPVNLNTATYIQPVGDSTVSLLLHMDGAPTATVAI